MNKVDQRRGDVIFVKLKVPLQVPLKVKVKVKVKVRTWSIHGQVRSDSNFNSNSNVGPELYTKIGFHHHSPPPSLNECLVNFVTLCDTL